MASKLERLKERERKYRTRKGGILSSLLAKKQAQQVKTPSPTSTPSGVKTSDQVVHGSNNFTFKLPVPKVKEKPSPPVSSKPKGTKQKVSTTADAGRGKVRITPSAVTTTKSAPQMVVRVPSPSQAGATPPTSKTTKTRQPSDQGIAPLIGAAAGAAAALGARYGAVKLAKKLAKPVARRTWQPRTKARPTEIIKQKTPKGPGPKLPPIAERGKGGWRPTETVGAKSAHPKPDAKPPGPTSTAKAATPRETDKFKVGKAAGSATARASVAPKAPPPTKPASQGAAGKPPKPKAPKPPADQQKQAGSTTRQAQTSPAGAGAHKSFAKSTSRQPPTEKRVERKGKPAVILRKGSAAAKRQNAPVATAAAPTSTTTEGTFTKAQLEEKIKKASGGARTTGKPQKPPVSTPKPSEVSTTKTGFPKAPRGSKLEGMPADFRLKTIVMTSGDRPYVKEGHIFVYGEGGGGPKKYSLDKYLKQFGQGKKGPEAAPKAPTNVKPTTTPAPLPKGQGKSTAAALKEIEEPSAEELRRIEKEQKAEQAAERPRRKVVRRAKRPKTPYVGTTAQSKPTTKALKTAAQRRQAVEDFLRKGKAVEVIDEQGRKAKVVGRSKQAAKALGKRLGKISPALLLPGVFSTYRRARRGK